VARMALRRQLDARGFQTRDVAGVLLLRANLHPLAPRELRLTLADADGAGGAGGGAGGWQVDRPLLAPPPPSPSLPY